MRAEQGSGGKKTGVIGVKMANSVSTGQFAGVEAVSETIGSASRHSIINAGQEQRPPGRRPFAIGRQEPGTLCRKPGLAPAEPGVAEGAET
jgi:hypothetical protein